MYLSKQIKKLLRGRVRVFGIETMDNNKKIIKPSLTGNEAEDFVEYFSQETFLKPWVFRSPKCFDGDEFSDIAILFKDKIVLIEVK